MSPWKGAKFTGDNFEQGADRAFNISLQDGYYCDINYVPEVNEVRTASNGLMEIAKLRSKEDTLPSFSFRWDEKDNQLDVDIQGVSRIVKHCFKHGTGGYAGNRPQRAHPENHVFKVDIRIPEKHIFHGYVQFNLNRTAKAAVSIGFKVSARTKVINKIKSIVKSKTV